MSKLLKFPLESLILRICIGFFRPLRFFKIFDVSIIYSVLKTWRKYFSNLEF